MEYTNAGISSHDAIIELNIVSDGKLYPIAISGRIPSGAVLSRMTLSDSAPGLSEGIYKALYRVYYYDSETGEKSLVSSDVEDITLTVKNG